VPGASAFPKDEDGSAVDCVGCSSEELLGSVAVVVVDGISDCVGLVGGAAAAATDSAAESIGEYCVEASTAT
jgi:hypothetical protein